MTATTATSRASGRRTTSRPKRKRSTSSRSSSTRSPARAACSSRARISASAASSCTASSGTSSTPGSRRCARSAPRRGRPRRVSARERPRARGGRTMTLTSERTELADRVVDAVDARRDELIAISRQIHAHPELNYEEHRASALLADALERWGFAVERRVGSVETAFRASAGRGAPTVAFLAEYDALPEIGHACGHNLIAISNAGAALGAKAAVAELGGTVQVIGTPAEEGGGGKIRLLEAGVFEGP